MSEYSAQQIKQVRAQLNIHKGHLAQAARKLHFALENPAVKTGERTRLINELHRLKGRVADNKKTLDTMTGNTEDV